MPLLYGSIAGYKVRRPPVDWAGRLRFASTAWRARLRCLFGVGLRTLRRGVFRLLAISTLRTYNAARIVLYNAPFREHGPEHRMQSHFASIVMLLITMVIWGSTFVVIKGINDQVQPFTLVGAAVGHDDHDGADRRRAVLRGIQLFAGVHVRRAGRAGSELHSCNDGAGRGRVAARARVGIALDRHRAVDGRRVDRVLGLGRAGGQCESAG